MHARFVIPNKSSSRETLKPSKKKLQNKKTASDSNKTRKRRKFLMCFKSSRVRKKPIFSNRSTRTRYILSWNSNGLKKKTIDVKNISETCKTSKTKTLRNTKLYKTTRQLIQTSWPNSMNRIKSEAYSYMKKRKKEKKHCKWAKKQRLRHRHLQSCCDKFKQMHRKKKFRNRQTNLMLSKSKQWQTDKLSGKKSKSLSAKN